MWSRIAALCVVLAGHAGAQSMWIVDSQDREGTQFTDLQPAIDVVPAGDILLVRDGSYSAATVNKGIQIHAMPGAVLDRARPASPSITELALRIHDVPPQERAVVAGLAIRFATVAGAATPLGLEIADCAGPVHLADIDVIGSTSGGVRISTPGLCIWNSAHVTIARCSTVDQGGVLIEQSTASAIDSSFEGAPAAQISARQASLASPGLRVINATVTLSRCDVRGGDSAIAGRLAAPGVLLRGDLTVTGTAATTIRGGTDLILTAQAFRGTGALTLDPIVRLIPDPAGPPPGIGPVTIATLPSLSVGRTQIGGRLRGDLRADPGAAFGLLLGVPAPPLASPFGSFWLHPARAFPVLAGGLDPTGGIRWNLPMPSNPRLVGAAIAWQAVALSAGGLRVSNAGHQVIRGN